MPISLSSWTFQDFLAFAFRRKWLILSGIAFSMAVAGVLCLVMPKMYRSNTLIVVESQKIPERYVPGVVSGTVQDRLNTIQQQVMSRTVLTEVINKFDLYKKERESKPIEGIIQAMRKEVRVDTQGGRRIESFTISFAHNDPIMAMRVTERLASRFIEENLKIREQFVEGATQFLDQELGTAEGALRAKEQAISGFKQKFMGELPGQLETNLRALDRHQKDLASTQLLLPKVRERLDSINRAVNTYDTKLADAVLSYTTRSFSESGTNASSVGKGIGVYSTRLEDLEKRLRVLSAEFTENYPDVIKLKREVDKLKSSQRSLSSKKDGGQSGKKASLVLAKSKKIGIKTDPYLAMLREQRSQVNEDLLAIQNRTRLLKKQIKVFEGRVARTPVHEQNLTVMARDFNNLQANYQSLLTKKLDAKIAENLERRQKGEHFRVLDPAYIPKKPFQPKIWVILLGGLAVGCGLGFGGAMLLEIQNPSFRREQDIELALGLPLLASIPEFGTVQNPGAGRVRLLGSMLPWSTDATSLQQIFRKKSLLPLNNGSPKGRNGNGQSHRGGYPRKGKEHQQALEPKDRACGSEFNLIAKWNPNSMVAEQYRVAATRLVLMGAERQSSIVAITSAVKGEGKTTTAINLAYTLERDLEKRTLIIDGDLKCPAVHTYLGLGKAPGLSDLFEGTQTLTNCIHQLGDRPLFVLPTGNRRENGVPLIKARKLGEIFAELRGQFDYIILDAPPIFPLADMNILGNMVDVLTLVVRAGETHQPLVQRALKGLHTKSDVAIILNGIRDEGMPFYMYREYLLPTH